MSDKFKPQPSLFETRRQEGYPKIMEGKWLGKWDAFALVDTPEQEKELTEKGYVVKEDE